MTNPELFVGTQSSDGAALDVGNSHIFGFHTRQDEKVAAC
jgi:hypothetical protein